MTDEEIAVAIAEHGKEIGSLKHRMNDVEKIVNVVHQLAQEMVGLTKEIKYMKFFIRPLHRSQLKSASWRESLQLVGRHL